MFNRGIAKRALPETAEDIALLLACLQNAVDRGLIEVHSYCVMTTHFGLFARSLTGELSAAMKILQNAYSRTFNRSR